MEAADLIEAKNRIHQIRHQIGELAKELKKLYETTGPDNVDVVINDSYGSFHVNDATAEIYETMSGRKLSMPERRARKRQDKYLIEALKELDAQGGYSDLRVVQADDNRRWWIHEYDGQESVWDHGMRLLNREDEEIDKPKLYHS